MSETGLYFPDPAAAALQKAGYDSSAFASDADGNVMEQLKAILANFPISSASFQNLPYVGASSTHLTLINPIAVVGNTVDMGGSMPAFPNVGPTTQTSCAAVYDATNRAGYWRNTTGGNSSITWTPFPGWRGSPVGVKYFDPSVFDFAGLTVAKGMLPPKTNTFVLEILASWQTAVVSARRTGMGISNSSAFDPTSRTIAFYRKSGGSGWTLISADGTTVSEASEASDTSDNALHVFRIEWEDKATPEARLYVDGVLKVTKTTDLPAIGITNLPSFVQCLAVDTAEATDTARFYQAAISWKTI